MTRRRTSDDPPSWRWSDLGYDMRVLTWWMRGNGADPDQEQRHPWWIVGVVVLCALLAAFVVLFLLGGFSLSSLRQSFSHAG